MHTHITKRKEKAWKKKKKKCISKTILSTWVTKIRQSNTGKCIIYLDGYMSPLTSHQGRIRRGREWRHLFFRKKKASPLTLHLKPFFFTTTTSPAVFVLFFNPRLYFFLKTTTISLFDDDYFIFFLIHIFTFFLTHVFISFIWRRRLLFILFFSTTTLFILFFKSHLDLDDVVIFFNDNSNMTCPKASCDDKKIKIRKVHWKWTNL